MHRDATYLEIKEYVSLGNLFGNITRSAEEFQQLDLQRKQIS